MQAHRTAPLAVLLLFALVGAACGDAAVSRQSLAVQYMAVATAGNRHLDADFDGLSGRDRANLEAARADLRDAAATERTFDTALLALPLPPALMATARALVTANEARAELTLRAATATTLDELQAYQARLSEADASVEQQVRTIRNQLGLPPPATS